MGLHQGDQAGRGQGQSPASRWNLVTGDDVLKPTSAAVVVFQSTNEAVFAVEFNPNDSTNIITCGKSHIYFWTLSSGQFTKKQGIFGVRPPSNRRSQRFFFFASSKERLVHIQTVAV